MKKEETSLFDEAIKHIEVTLKHREVVMYDDDPGLKIWKVYDGNDFVAALKLLYVGTFCFLGVCDKGSEEKICKISSLKDLDKHLSFYVK